MLTVASIRFDCNQQINNQRIDGRLLLLPLQGVAKAIAFCKEELIFGKMTLQCQLLLKMRWILQCNNFISKIFKLILSSDRQLTINY